MTNHGKKGRINAIFGLGRRAESLESYSLISHVIHELQSHET
jgi:hypothetical protein